ncbi:hypothetical protein BGW80DRAFT_1345097 [Lactifluus volemus]|nr:hypothetical protein BGW80DRAFT_1345097 [Lactifluus volemus]
MSYLAVLTFFLLFSGFAFAQSATCLPGVDSGVWRKEMYVKLGGMMSSCYQAIAIIPPLDLSTDPYNTYRPPMNATSYSWQTWIQNCTVPATASVNDSFVGELHYFAAANGNTPEVCNIPQSS